MTKPSWDGALATDDNYNAPTKTWHNQPTKVVLSAGNRNEGWEPEAVLPAQHFNYHVNQLGNHAQYIQDSWDANDEHQYPDGVVSRTKEYSIFLFEGWRTSFITGIRQGLQSSIDSEEAIFPLHRILPDGAVLQSVDVMVDPGAARATVLDRVGVSLDYVDHNWVTPTQTPTTGAVTRDDGTSNLQVITLSSLATTIGSVVGRIHSLRVIAGADAATNNDTINAIRLTWDDKGYRNF